MSSYEKFLPKSGDNLQMAIINARLMQLEKIVSVLCYVIKEMGNDFWHHTTPEEQQVIADFYDEQRD